MKSRALVFLLSAISVGAIIVFGRFGRGEVAGEPAAGKRQPWTTTKITGSPEPPHPYRIVPAFPKLKFKNPLHMTSAPGTNRMFVLEHAGKIFSFPNKPNVEKADLVIDAAKDLAWKPNDKIQGFDAVYGLTFHPKFVENRYCYISYVLKGKGAELPDGSRVSRFKMTNADPPTIDPATGLENRLYHPRLDD